MPTMTAQWATKPFSVGIVRFVRDEPKTIPVALFGPRNIVKNSLSIQYIMPSEETADSVCVQYFSEKTWKASEIVGSFEGSSSDKTATVELFGCTNKDQAQREAVYMALANRYRRRIVTFSRTHFAFGKIDKWGVLARVVGIRPRSDKVEITAVVENNKVHEEVA